MPQRFVHDCTRREQMSRLFLTLFLALALAVSYITMAHAQQAPARQVGPAVGSGPQSTVQPQSREIPAGQPNNSSATGVKRAHSTQSQIIPQLPLQPVTPPATTSTAAAPKIVSVEK